MIKVPTILKYGFLFSLIVTLASCIGSKERGLFRAFQINDWQTAQQIINEGANLDSVGTSQGETPLHIATKNNKLKLAKIIVDKKANINLVDHDGISPIFWAALYDNKDMVEMLIESGAYVDVKDSKGNTPLHWAALGGSYDVAELFIRQGLKVNEPNFAVGEEPIHYVVMGPLIPSLIQKIPKENYLEQFESLIHSEINKIILIIKQKSIDNYIKTAELFISNGVNVNTRNEHPKGHYKTPLHMAVMVDQGDLAKLLIQKGADVNAIDGLNSTPICWATAYGPKKNVELLLANGAQINFHSQYGTPLHIAVKENRPENAKFLLENGADPNITDRKGKTPADYALEKGQLELVRLFRKSALKK